MAKIVRCRDVGVDCDFEARGETEKEIWTSAGSTVGVHTAFRN